MATIEELGQALRAAHAAGNAADAQRIADAIDMMRGAPREDKYVKPHNVVMGGLKGAANIGATLMRPVDAVLNATGLTDKTNVERRADLDRFFNERADTGSNWFKGGELASEIAGTAGVGGALGKGALAVGEAIPALSRAAAVAAPALESGGLSLGRSAGNMTVVEAALARMGAGAATGGAMAGLVDPEDAGTGAMLGGILPGAVKAAGWAGKGVGSMIPRADNRRTAMARAAKDQFGIDIPADRIANSKVMDATAGSLNYVPFAGRAQTEERMVEQMNRAIAKLVGQNTDNVGMALENARTKLSGEFDRVLTGNTVKMTPKFKQALVDNLDEASRTLTPDQLGVIKRNVDDLVNVPVGADINGEAAYAFKRMLDKISAQNVPHAENARQLKKSLMDALNDSLGPKAALAFKDTRTKYGRMLELEKLAGNVEGAEISAARLGNKKSRDPELRRLQRIAATFIKPREGAHSQQQRAWVGGLGTGAAALIGGIPATAAAVGTMAGGRLANTLLNSKAAKEIVMRRASQGGGRLQQLLEDPSIRAGLLAGYN